MTTYDQSIEDFLRSPNAEVMCISGQNGSGKTFWLSHFFRKRSNLQCVYTYGKKPSGTITGALSIRYFCTHHVMTRSYPSHMDVLVLDDFHMNSVEKDVVLMAWSKKVIPCKKLIVVSSFLSQYHVGILEMFTQTKKETFEIYHYTGSVASYSDLSCPPFIEYRDCLADNEDQLYWEFDKNAFIPFPTMCEMVDSILEECNDPRLERYRVLVYVQSPDMCEKMAEYYSRHTCLVVATVHGQKSKNEVYELLHESRIQMIFLTNIRVRVDDFISNSFHVIIDFGMSYSMTKFGFVTMGYCSQSEMIHKSSFLQTGYVYRIMSEDFYNALPYAEWPIFDWKPFLVHCAMHKSLSYFMFLCSPLNSKKSKDPCVVTHSQEIFHDIHFLKKCHLLTEEHSLTCHHRNNEHVLHKLLSSSFQVENYSVIAHLYRIHETSCLPESILLLTTMLIALVDTILKHGRHRVFLLPRLSNKQPSQILISWLRVLLFCNGEIDDSDSYIRSTYQKFLWTVFEVYLSIILQPNGYTMNLYNIHPKTWQEFVFRWKSLWCMMGMCPKTDSEHKFLRFAKDKLERNVVKKDWCLKNGTYPKYFFRNVKKHGDAIRGSIGHLHDKIRERLLETMWKLSDYSTWTSNLCPYSRKIFFNAEFYPPNVSVNPDYNLHLPLPTHVVSYIDELRSDKGLCDAANQMNSFIQSKKKGMETFRNTVVQELENEVAYRPDKYKYYEAMMDFKKYQQSFA